MQATEVYRHYAMEIDTHEVDHLVKNTSELEISKKRKASNEQLSPNASRVQKRNKAISPRKIQETNNECNHTFSAGPLPVNAMDELFVVGREHLCLNNQPLPKGSIIIEKGWSFNSKTGRADKIFQALHNGTKGRISSAEQTTEIDSYTLLMEYSRKLTICDKCQKWSI